MVNDRVFTDTGPLIHLSEIEAIPTLDIFKTIHIPTLVIDELTRFELPGHDIVKRKQFKSVHISEGSEKLSKELILSYSMGKNDAAILAIAIENKGRILLTDDLEVRRIAKINNIQPVGSIGVLLRAFRDEIITYDELLKRLEMIVDRSTLFITMDLIEEVMEAARKYERSK